MAIEGCAVAALLHPLGKGRCVVVANALEAIVAVALHDMAPVAPPAVLLGMAGAVDENGAVAALGAGTKLTGCERTFVTVAAAVAVRAGVRHGASAGRGHREQWGLRGGKLAQVVVGKASSLSQDLASAHEGVRAMDRPEKGAKCREVFSIAPLLLLGQLVGPGRHEDDGRVVPDPCADLAELATAAMLGA